MYIDQGNMILNMKTAQKLEVVEKIDILDKNALTRAIRDAINAENDAIKQYEVIAEASPVEKVRDVLQDIANEEKVHVGELQEILRMLLKDEQDFLDEGAKEVQDKST